MSIQNNKPVDQKTSALDTISKKIKPILIGGVIIGIVIFVIGLHQSASHEALSSFMGIGGIACFGGCWGKYAQLAFKAKLLSPDAEKEKTQFNPLEKIIFLPVYMETFFGKITKDFFGNESNSKA